MFLQQPKEIQTMLHDRLVETREQWRRDAERADKSIKHCQLCNKCWEFITYSTGKKNARTAKIPFFYKNLCLHYFNFT